MTWKEYIDTTKNKPARSILKEALTYVTNKEKALDLGAGALNETLAIAQSGFCTIDVVDIEPSVAEFIVHLRTKISSEQNLSFYNQSFESFVFIESKYDLINAQYSLPFIMPTKFDSIWSNISASMQDHGVFTGTFFGIEDEWNDGTKSNMRFHTKEELISLFTQSQMKFITFEESNKIGTTASGAQKHWHVFDVIAIRQRSF